MRWVPSTFSASFERACRLSRVRAFSMFFSPRLSSLLTSLPLAMEWIAASMSSSSRWAYQMSMVRIWAKSAIAVR